MRLLTFFTILSIVINIAPAMAIETPPIKNHLPERINSIKSELLRASIYSKYSNIDFASTYYGDKANEMISELYEKCIFDLRVKDIPWFLNQTRILIKFYDFSPFNLLEVLKEKVINLHLTEPIDKISEYLNNVDAMLESSNNSSVKVAGWWVAPAEEEQALYAYGSRNYLTTLTLYAQAIERWREIVPPADATSSEINEFKITRDWHIAFDTDTMSDCYLHLENYSASISAARESLRLYAEGFMSMIYNNISHTLRCRCRLARLYLWTRNDFNTAISIAGEIENELSNYSYTTNQMLGELWLLYSECHRFNGDYNQSISALRKSRTYFSSHFSDNEVYKTLYNSYCDVCEGVISQINDSGNPNAVNELYRKALAGFSTYPVYNAVFPWEYERMIECKNIAIPYVKTILIDRKLTPVFIEPDKPVKIYFDYIFPFNTKPYSRIDFFSYKIKLEIYQGDNNSSPVYMDTIDIAGVSTESVKLSFTWPGFDKGSTKDGETFLAKVSSVAKDLHTGKEKTTAEDKLTFFNGVPLVIIESDNKKHYNIDTVDEEPFSLKFYVAPVGNDNKLSICLKNMISDDEIFRTEHSANTGQNIFIWDFTFSDGLKISPGKYNCIIGATIESCFIEANFTFFVVELEFVYIVDSQHQIISNARIGRWGSNTEFSYSHDHVNVVYGVDGYYLDDFGRFKVKNSEPSNNFIDVDEDKFYLKVIDHSKNLDPLTREKISVKLYSRDRTINSVDGIKSTTLEETSEDSGEFVSQSHLLVSRDDSLWSDDLFEVFDKFSMSYVPDGDPDDRTLQAVIGGNVFADYYSGANVVSKSVPVDTSEGIYTLNLRFRIFFEPVGDDINGNHIQDTMWGSEERAKSLAEQNINRTRLSLSQAGIIVNCIGISFETAPSIFDPSSNEYINILSNGFISIINEQELNALVSEFYPETSDDILEIFVVSEIIQTTRGGRGVLGQTLPPFIKQNGLNGRTFIILSSKSSSPDLRILSHEICHALENRRSYDDLFPNAPHIFYPGWLYWPPDDSDVYYTGPRRMTLRTRNGIRVIRNPASDFSAFGNTLLNVEGGLN